MTLSCMALSLTASLIISCDDDDNGPTGGKLMIKFEHQVAGEPLVLKEMKYENEAGNPFEVTEIQWFISDVTLHKTDGSSLLLDYDDDFVHYIDTNLPNTLEWEKKDNVPVGDYQGIAITFGIKGPKNLPDYFSDPPESLMEWPYHMGGDYGGYHYMKLNGFWRNLESVRGAFNFHLGVGPKKDDQGNTIFVQNWFEVMLPNSSFSLADRETKEITIVMNVENWFTNPHTYDINDYDEGIMNNQDAQEISKMNGQQDVFSLGTIKKYVE